MKKKIYLDQNKWIELAKARKDGVPSDAQNILSLIDNKVANGEWTFPLSYVHLQETAKISDDVRRNYLSVFMNSISKGSNICASTDVQKAEIYNGIQAIKKGEKSVARVDVIFENWITVSGLPIDIELPFDVSDFSIMVECIHASLGMSLDDGAEYKQLLEKHRNWLSGLPKGIKEVFFTGHFLIEKMKSHFGNHYGIGHEKLSEYYGDNREKIIDWFKQMPSFYCESKLLYYMMRNKNYPIDEHDFLDLMALSVAIPYCDVIITERQWGKVACNQLHLDKLYGKRIATSIFELNNI